jgi:hypothetical protein
MRRLAILVVVLVAALVVADRVAAHAADGLVARQIERDQGLASRPDVSIGGFPFLTQAISGHYGEVTLTLHDVRRGPVTVAQLTAHLVGVHVSLSAVFSQHLSSVPVDMATAGVFVTYADLNSYLSSKHLQVSDAHGRLHVTGSITVAGQTESASADGQLRVSGDAVVVTAGRGLGFAIPLTGLPFRIHLESATVGNRGITVKGSAQGLVLHPRS